MGFLSWIIVGLIAGALGKAIYPGHQGGGLLATLGLGICGSIVGGWLGSLIFGVGTGFSLGGIIMAVLGSMICIFLWGLLTNKG